MRGMVAAISFVVLAVSAIAQGPVEGPVALDRADARRRQLDAQTSAEITKQQKKIDELDRARKAAPENDTIRAQFHGESMRQNITVKNYEEQRSQIERDLARDLRAVAAEIERQGLNNQTRGKIEEVRQKIATLDRTNPLAKTYAQALALYERGEKEAAQEAIRQQQRAAELNDEATQAEARQQEHEAGAALAAAAVAIEYVRFEAADRQRSYQEITQRTKKLQEAVGFDPLAELRRRYALDEKAGGQR